jgi:hypothetical protein
VTIGREQDRRAAFTGQVISRTSSVVKVAVGSSVIPFHPTGLERAGAAGAGVGLQRGLRVIVGRR